MTPHRRTAPIGDRGMVTAEYTVGTLGAVMIATVLYRFGLLGIDSPWFEHLHDIVERALSWHNIFKGLPRLGIRLR